MKTDKSRKKYSVAERRKLYTAAIKDIKKFTVFTDEDTKESNHNA